MVLDGWPYGASRSITRSNSPIDPVATLSMLHASPVIRWISRISGQCGTSGSCMMHRDP